MASMQDATPLTPQQLPIWYGEVPAEERSDAVPRQAGAAQLLFCDRGAAQLIVSFGHTDDMDHPELDWSAWTDRLARTNQWSHLSICAPKGSWFRDTKLIQILEEQRDAGLFKRFDRVTFFGPAPLGSGFAALAFAPLSPGAHVLALDAQSTLNMGLVDWETRFDVGDATGWSLPYSDAAMSIEKAGKVYLGLDPLEHLDVLHANRIKGGDVTRIHGFGLYGDIGVALKRLGLLKGILADAVVGTLDLATFYANLRARRTLYLYRRGMERHLEARGRSSAIESFIAGFRRNKRKQMLAKESKKKIVQRAASSPPVALAKADASQFPSAPEAPQLAGRRYPRTLGNVWGLRDDGSGFRYFSDQYGGSVLGFEEQHGITLAETHPLALGMAAFGHVAGLQRALPEDFRFHVVDETLQGKRGAFQATAQAVAFQRMAAKRQQAYRTIVALSEPQSGITREEALPDSARYLCLMRRITAAQDALKSWNKDFHLDRISLSLLAGEPGTSLDDALRHYGEVARSMRYDAAVAAGQGSFPHICVAQSAGTATDGTSEVILAEGQLDTAHPALDIIVATPTYPFALMSGMPATLSLRSQLLVDELSALAVATRQESQHWYCPALRQAYGKGTTVVVEFVAQSPLVLEDGAHGLSLDGATNMPKIVDLRVQGTKVILTLDQPPEGREIFVNYAWGRTRDNARDDKYANHGALRDSWSQPSVLQPNVTLHRYALSGRVRLMPSDLPINLSGVNQ